MSHEGSTANLLNARHESLVAEHVQHENVVRAYSFHVSEVSRSSWPRLVGIGVIVIAAQVC